MSLKAAHEQERAKGQSIPGRNMRTEEGTDFAQLEDPDQDFAELRVGFSDEDEERIALLHKGNEERAAETQALRLDVNGQRTDIDLLGSDFLAFKRDVNGQLEQLEKDDEDIATLQERCRIIEGAYKAQQGELAELRAKQEAPESGGFAYNFKINSELMWVIGSAAVAYIYQVLQSPERVDDWSTWLIALAIGTFRAVVGAVMAFFTTRTQKQEATKVAAAQSDVMPLPRTAFNIPSDPSVQLTPEQIESLKELLTISRSARATRGGY